MATTVPTEVEVRITTELDRLASHVSALGIALSGGGDSTALLQMAANWAASRNVRLAAATVDHCLRPESATEARTAGAACARLGIAHRILVWPPPHPPGNTAAEGRKARLRLLAGWARESGLGAVALGHTRDDVAETLLMRLARGAGIDGLAAMVARREAEGMLWLRPLLPVGRTELRNWLVVQDIEWTDDPTNDDQRHERARIRHAMRKLGLDAGPLAEAAAHLRAARDTLGILAQRAMAEAEAPSGMLVLPRPGWDAAPPELRRLILVAAVRWISAAPYPPRAPATVAALRALSAGQAAQLGGALIRPGARALRILREPAAASRAIPLTTDGTWDNRWRISGLPQGHEVRAIGGVAAGIDRRGLPLAAIQSAPGLWRGATFIAPLSEGTSAGMGASPLRGTRAFHQLLAGA